VLSTILLDAHNPGPMTATGNNTYLLVGADRSATLVDAGVGDPRHLDALTSALATQHAHLTRVLVTHFHADHASGAPAIAARHPAATFAKCPWPDEDGRYTVEWRPIAEGDVEQIGDDQLTALHTPGHSPDHLAFWHEPTRAVFTGDLVTLGSSVMIHWSRGGDLAQYMASLERLLALDARTLLPAHGARIDDPHAVLTGYLDHRRQRERQVLAALEAGRSTVQAIAESIYDGLDPALLPAARENVRAHLEKLKAEGIARDEAGRWRL